LNQQCFQVGEFFLDPANRLLRHGEVFVSLSPKAFDALVYLARNPGRLLTRDELIQALWPDSYVEEGNLSVHIFQVRKALGTAADGKAYIQTVPKKGYRFIAEVKVLDQPANALAREALGLPGIPPPIPAPAAMEADKVGLSNGTAPKASRVDEEASPRTWVEPLRGLPEGKPGQIGLRAWKLVAGGAACLLALIAIAQRFVPTRQERGRLGSPSRLTSFSPELSVSAAAISPDGKTLAYANPVGIFLEEIATKETRRLHSPAPDLRVSNLSWFANGTRLLATGAEPDAPAQSVWILPAKGMSDPERVGAFQRSSISPDASQIALVHVSSGAKQILLLPTGGGQPRPIGVIPAEEDLGSIFWAVDGQRLQFVALRWNAQLRANQGFIRSINLSTGKTEEILSRPNLSGEAISLPDGRLVYGQLLGANPAGSYGGELREVHVDSRTDKIVGDSASLGRWTEQVIALSTSADGRRLVFRTVLSQHSVFEGDLEERGESLSRVRRLTFGRGRDDFPRAWTPDSKAIFFDSNRNGKWEIFKQALDQISDEPYLQSANDEFSPRMSPDGRSLLYLDRPREWRESEPVRLMRVSMVERFPQVVLQTAGYSEWGLRFECARTPGAPCVLQRAGSDIVFRRFDSERDFDAAKSDVLRIPLDANLKISWALTPDGSHLAWIISDAPDATIHVASLRRSGSDRSALESSDSVVVLKDLSYLHALSWSPDGNGWYVTTRLPASWRIFHTNGVRTQVLWRGQGGYSPEPWPSPNDRHLAFSELEQDSNVWMLENF
jgi:DNA-binding winged helix-turn-helix (wHTH) protein/Tol biopolymer transport system component